MKNLLKKILTCAVCAFIATSCSKSSGSSNSSAPASTITSANPISGPDSTVVTIVGTGFSATAVDNNVSFNGKQATLISSSTTQIQAMVPTLAGTGPLTVTVNGKTVTAETFAYDTTWRLTPVIHNIYAPYSLSIDEGGSLYFGSYTSGNITRVSPKGASSIFAFAGGPTGSVMDGNGNLYVSALIGADSSSILKIDPTGAISVIARDSGYIYGLAMDAVTGNFYAANDSKSTVDKITAQGVVSVLAGNLNDPSGIAVTSDGNVYVNNYSSTGYDPASGVITKITPSGSATTFLAIGKYDAESAMTTDGTNLYLTVFDQVPGVSSIVRISPAGAVSTLISGNGISVPRAITRDNTGSLYVANFLDTLAAGATTGSIVKLAAH